jgi:hypothetical protein
MINSFGNEGEYEENGTVSKDRLLGDRSVT